jgi:hypothetical protein
MLATGVGGNVELVSRKLSAPGCGDDGLHHPFLAEVGKYVAALGGKSTDPFGYFTNDTCGLHVHVGVPARKCPDKCGTFSLQRPPTSLLYSAPIRNHHLLALSPLTPRPGPQAVGLDQQRSDGHPQNPSHVRMLHRHLLRRTAVEDGGAKYRDHRQGPSDTTRFKFILTSPTSTATATNQPPSNSANTRIQRRLRRRPALDPLRPRPPSFPRPAPPRPRPRPPPPAPAAHPLPPAPAFSPTY